MHNRGHQSISIFFSFSIYVDLHFGRRNREGECERERVRESAHSDVSLKLQANINHLIAEQVDRCFERQWVHQGKGPLALLQLVTVRLFHNCQF